MAVTNIFHPDEPRWSIAEIEDRLAGLLACERALHATLTPGAESVEALARATDRMFRELAEKERARLFKLAFGVMRAISRELASRPAHAEPIALGETPMSRPYEEVRDRIAKALMAEKRLYDSEDKADRGTSRTAYIDQMWTDASPSRIQMYRDIADDIISDITAGSSPKQVRTAPPPLSRVVSDAVEHENQVATTNKNAPSMGFDAGQESYSIGIMPTADKIKNDQARKQQLDNMVLEEAYHDGSLLRRLMERVGGNITVACRNLLQRHLECFPDRPWSLPDETLTPRPRSEAPLHPCRDITYTTKTVPNGVEITFFRHQTPISRMIASANVVDECIKDALHAFQHNIHPTPQYPLCFDCPLSELSAEEAIAKVKAYDAECERCAKAFIYPPLPPHIRPTPDDILSEPVPVEIRPDAPMPETLEQQTTRKHLEWYERWHGHKTIRGTECSTCGRPEIVPETLLAKLPAWLAVIAYRLPRPGDLHADTEGFTVIAVKGQKCETPKYILGPIASVAPPRPTGPGHAAERSGSETRPARFPGCTFPGCGVTDPHECTSDGRVVYTGAHAPANPIATPHPPCPVEHCGLRYGHAGACRWNPQNPVSAPARPHAGAEKRDAQSAPSDPSVPATVAHHPDWPVPKTP